MSNPNQKVFSDEVEYGPVVVTSGIHKGKGGYFDDFEGNRAIVYLCVPLFSDYILVRTTQIKRIESKWFNKFKEECPDFCNFMGL